MQKLTNLKFLRNFFEKCVTFCLLFALFSYENEKKGGMTMKRRLMADVGARPLCLLASDLSGIRSECGPMALCRFGTSLEELTAR